MNLGPGDIKLVKEKKESEKLCSYILINYRKKRVNRFILGG